MPTRICALALCGRADVEASPRGLGALPTPSWGQSATKLGSPLPGPRRWTDPVRLAARAR
eukprot:scaffold6361_cov132-Isochrysis_galbana.AAC.4